MNLKNKVAIVSGGARDIGRAVSVKLASEGAKVAVNYYNSQEDADQTLREIEAVGGEAILIKGDMTKQEDVDRLVTEATAAFGDHVDVLVNVVGGLVARKTLQEMDADFFDFLLLNALWPLLAFLSRLFVNKQSTDHITSLRAGDKLAEIF